MKLVNEEMTKLKKDPQYINFFKEKVSKKWGNKEIQQAVEEIVTYFETEEPDSIYDELVLMRQTQNRIHLSLNKAIKQGEKALEILKRYGHQRTVISLYHELMQVYMIKGEIGKALSKGQEGLDLANQEKEDGLQIDLLLTHALLYILIKNDEQVDLLISQLEKSTFLLNYHQKSQLAALKSVMALKRGDIQAAMNEGQLAYEIETHFLGAGIDNDRFSQILILRAIIFLARDLPSQADKDLKEALKLANTWQHELVQIIGLVGQAYEQIVKAQYEKAEENLHHSEKLIEKTGAHCLKSLIYQVRGLFYEKQGAWEKAYHNLKKEQLFWQRLNKEVLVGTQSAGSLEPKIVLKDREKDYQRFKELAQIGQLLSESLGTLKFSEETYKVLSNLIPVELIGVAKLKEGSFSYRVFNGKGKILEAENDIVRYTERIVENCMTFQHEIVINNGNFEEYSLKMIQDSTSKAILKSMMIYPLSVENQVIGCLMLASYKEDSYGEQEQILAKIVAHYLSMALKSVLTGQKTLFLREHDALTGVLSRSAALGKGEVLFKTNQKKGKKTGVILLDADQFKQINEKYGHDFGDQVLQKVGMIIKGAARKEDYVGRFDGEEFVIILNDCNGKEAEKVAKTIKEQLQQTVFTSKKQEQVIITISGGIYLCNEYTLNFADAIRFADHALYRAKLLGKNQMISYSLSV